MNKANAQRRENPTLIKTESADEIPVVHRLAIIYLMLPVVIWLVGLAPVVVGCFCGRADGIGAVAGAKTCTSKPQVASLLLVPCVLRCVPRQSSSC